MVCKRGGNTFCKSNNYFLGHMMNSIFDSLIHAVKTKDLLKWQSHYQILSIKEKEHIVQQNYYQLFHLAASYGDFEIFTDTINAILENIDESYTIDRLKEAFAAREGEGLRYALKNKHAEIVKEFLIGSLEEGLYTESLIIILEESNYIEYICTLSLKDVIPDVLKLACLTGTEAVELVLNIVSFDEILRLMDMQMDRLLEEGYDIPAVDWAWLAIFAKAAEMDAGDDILYLCETVSDIRNKSVIISAGRFAASKLSKQNDCPDINAFIKSNAPNLLLGGEGADKTHFMSSIYKNNITAEFEYYPWGFGQGYIVKSFTLLRQIIRCQKRLQDSIIFCSFVYLFLGLFINYWFPNLGGMSAFLFAVFLVSITLLGHQKSVKWLTKGLDRTKKPLIYIEYYKIRHGNNIKGNVEGCLMGLILIIVLMHSLPLQIPQFFLWILTDVSLIGLLLSLIQLYAHCKLKLP